MARIGETIFQVGEPVVLGAMVVLDQARFLDGPLPPQKLPTKKPPRVLVVLLGLQISQKPEIRLMNLMSIKYEKMKRLPSQHHEC